MNLLYGDDEAVAKWVAERIPGLEFMPPYVAIGIGDDEGKPLGGVVFHQWNPRRGTMEISGASDSPKCAQRGIAYTLLAYPFLQLGANKVYTAIPHGNRRAIRFISGDGKRKGIGFTQEAVLAHQFGPGVHAVICRLLRRDFMRLYKPRPLMGQSLVQA